MNKDLRKKLTAYSSLAGAFLAGGTQEAEGQIIYVDIPDQKVCAMGDLGNAVGSGFSGSSETFNSYRFFHLDMDGQAYSTSVYRRNGSGSFNTNTKADILFIANAWLDNDSQHCRDDDAWAYVYGYNNSWNNLSNFVGTATNGYIKKLNFGDNIGPSEMIADNFNTWGVMPAIGYSEDCTSSVPTSRTFQYGDPNWISGFPANATTGYVGVNFDIEGETHYGWIHVAIDQEVAYQPGVTNGDLRASSCITIIDYAYNSVAEAPIRAGEGRPELIPTMGEWGLISLNLLLLIFGFVAIRNKNRDIVLQKR